MTIVLAVCTEEEVSKEKVLYVKAQRIGQSNVNTENIYAGTVCGRYETKMSFQVDGQIIRRNVDVGSRVTNGDLLMEIDSKDILQQSNQGDVQVLSVLAQLKLAANNLNRYNQLYEQEAIPAALFDQ